MTKTLSYFSTLFYTIFWEKSRLFLIFLINNYFYVKLLLFYLFKYKILQSKTIHNKIELEFLNIFYGKCSSLPWKGAVKNILEIIRIFYLIVYSKNFILKQ